MVSASVAVCFCGSVLFQGRGSIYRIVNRFKHFKVKRTTTHGTPTAIHELALEHFDFFYGPIFKAKWPSVRLGLLSDQKYCALLNNYSAVEKNAQTLFSMGAYDLISHVTNVRSMESKKWEALDPQNPHAMVPPASQSNDSLPGESCSKDGLDASDGSERTNSFDSPAHEPDQYDWRYMARDESSLLEFAPHRSEDSVDISDVLPRKTKAGTSEGSEKEYWLSKFRYAQGSQGDKEPEVQIVPEPSIQYPEHLRVMLFPPGDITIFPQTNANRFGTLGHYLMDCSSIVPVLALNLQPNDSVLDLCSAPGGKALVALQTLLPSLLVCNDFEESGERIARLRSTLDSYLPRDAAVRKRVFITKFDAAGEVWDDSKQFDKVLVDVPCTTDRLSVHSADNNIFKRTRMKERLQLPQKQEMILKNGIRALKPGGELVYATCTLSPLQNDSVIEAVLAYFHEYSSDVQIVVKDLDCMVNDFEKAQVFKFWNASPGCKYGKLIVPYMSSNFGPMYCAKLQRL